MMEKNIFVYEKWLPVKHATSRSSFRKNDNHIKLLKVISTSSFS